MKAHIICVIILIIFIFIYINAKNTFMQEKYLYGFWVAENDDFCERADISSMMIFIGPADKSWRGATRTWYIIIMNDLCNQGFTISYRPALFCTDKYTIYAT